MATKVTLNDPTGSDQWIADLGVWVENGGSVEIENPVLVARLLQSPNWEGRMPSKKTLAEYGVEIEPSSETDEEPAPDAVTETPPADAGGEGA